MQSLKSFRCLNLGRLISSRNESTYYDILNVKKDSSNKEIRSAFVELTKKFHPDASGSSTDGEFVKISEAYKVLSKSDLRSAYDRHLLSQSVPQTSNTGGMHTTEFHRPWEINPDYAPKPGPYYGIRGVGRVSNTKIAIILFALGVFFSVLGFTTVSRSFALHRDHYDKKSAEAAHHHELVRADARKYGNDEQLKRMVHKIFSQEYGPSTKEINSTKATKTI